MKLAIVSPCYNEQEILSSSAQRLSILFDELISKGKISSDSFILFVNDGSRDNTWNIITEMYKTNKYIYGLNLSGNVGHQNAIMAGMMAVRDRSDAVITIDADLQDDLNAIEQMIDRYKEGNDIVYGVKVSRKADPYFKKKTACAFYKLQETLGVKTIYNHADFRLLSRRALQQLSLYDERNLYLRGIVPLLGYRSATVDDVICERSAGQSKYTLKKMLKLALDGITSFSTRPIHYIFVTAFVFFLISFGIMVYTIYSYIQHSVVPGWTSLMLSLWFIASIILFSLGVIGQYIGKIYVEIKKRPLYHIDEFLCDKQDFKE